MRNRLSLLGLVLVCAVQPVTGESVLGQSEGVRQSEYEGSRAECGFLAGKQSLDVYAGWLWVNHMGALLAFVEGDDSAIEEVLERLTECEFVKDNGLREGLARYTRARILYDFDRPAEAEQIFADLLSGSMLGDLVAEKVSALVFLLAQRARREGQEESAITVLSALLEEQGELLNEKVRYIAHHALAIAHERLGRRQEAAVHYARALEGVEANRLEVLLRPSRAGMLGERRWVFYNFLDFLLQDGDAVDVLKTAERANANVLLDVLFLRNAAERRNALRYLLQARLRADIMFSQLFREKESAEVEEVLRQLASHTQRRLAAVDAGKGTEEALQRAAVLALEEIGGGLSGDLPPIVFYVEMASYQPIVLVLADGTITIKRLALGVLELRALTLDFGLCIFDRACEEWEKQGRRLYRHLVEPVEGLLRRSREVVIVRSGSFQLVNFDALIDGRGRGLGLVKAVSYAPGLAYLKTIRARETRAKVGATRRLAVLRDSAEDATKGVAIRQLENGSKRACREGLAYSEVPMRDFGEASLPRFADSSIVHVDGHGWFFRDFPLLSGVEFRRRDGSRWFFALIDLFENVGFDDSIVVLSSCQLGFGTPLGFGEDFSPGAAFIAAGASSVVATIADVPAAATDRLLATFYQQYLRGVSVAEALRRARVEANGGKKARRHPLEWGMLAAYGDGSATLCVADGAGR